MTPSDIRRAALWLRQAARTAGARLAGHLLDRRHKPRRDVATMPRDTKGRWTATQYQQHAPVLATPTTKDTRPL